MEVTTWSVKVIRIRTRTTITRAIEAQDEDEAIAKFRAMVDLDGLESWVLEMRRIHPNLYRFLKAQHNVQS